MSEFKREYEYMDDKVGGVLYFFIAMIASTEMIFCFMILTQVLRALETWSILRGICWILCLLFTLLSVFTIIAFYKLPRKALKYSKVYLAVRAVYFSLSTIGIFIYDITHRMVDNLGQLPTIPSLVMGSMIPSILYSLAFSMLWYLYLMKSKNIQYHYAYHGDSK